MCFDGSGVAVTVAAVAVVVVKSVKTALSTFDRQVEKIVAWKQAPSCEKVPWTLNH